MFNEVSYSYGLNNGLGDAYTACLNAVRTYGEAYVFAGSQIRYQADLVAGSGAESIATLWSTYQSRIQSSVASRGYRDVRVEGPTIGLWVDGKGNVTIDLVAPIDQADLGDVQGNIDGAISQVGLRVTFSSIYFRNKPSFEQICSGQARTSVPGGGTARGDVEKDKPGKCDKEEGLNWVACELGVSTSSLKWTGVAIGTAVAVVLVASLLKR